MTDPARGGPLTRRSVLGGALGAGLLAFEPDNEAMAEILAAPAGPGDPRVHTRAEWRAKPPKNPSRVLSRPPDRIVVHHTASPNSPDSSLEHAFRLSRDIQRFHMRGRGWDDTGQQLTISRGGHVMEGRNRSLSSILAGRHVVGAQALHHNEHTIGIENEGTYMKAPVPASLWRALVDVCHWLCEEYGLDPQRGIVGHRDYNDTTCPGDVLYSRLPELRSAVAARLDGAPAPSDPLDPEELDRATGSRGRPGTGSGTSMETDATSTVRVQPDPAAGTAPEPIFPFSDGP